jgi:hypothetical protein
MFAARQMSISGITWENLRAGDLQTFNATSSRAFIFWNPQQRWLALLPSVACSISALITPVLSEKDTLLK